MAAQGGSLVEWRDLSAFQLAFCWRTPDGAIGMPSGGGGPGPADELGSVRLLVPFSTVTGQRVGAGVERCSLDPAPPPLPPPPPTAIELWDATGLRRPQILVSPPRGLVGFETWFWSNVPDRPVSVTVTIRGWTATVTAEPVEWIWDPGDGSGRLSATRPGTETDPAVRHPYIRQGDYEVTHTVVWRGSFNLSGHGITVADQGLGTVRPSGSASFDVQEREAVIIG